MVLYRNKEDREKKNALRVSIRPRLVRPWRETPTGAIPMKYLSFVRSAEKYREAQPPAALMEAMGQLVEKFKKDGALVDTGGLAPSKQGFRMRLEKGKYMTTDGPFAETKEVIGGWAILKADSKDEILRLTKEFMEVHRKHWPEFEFECEVRPIEFHAKE
jgi:hypothetical protein